MITDSTVDVLLAPAFTSHSVLSPAPAAATTSAERFSTRIPASMPRDQAYYWTERWRAGEEAALRELARGEGREFDTGRDAIGWLLSED